MSGADTTWLQVAIRSQVHTQRQSLHPITPLTLLKVSVCFLAFSLHESLLDSQTRHEHDTMKLFFFLELDPTHAHTTHTHTLTHLVEQLAVLEQSGRRGARVVQHPARLAAASSAPGRHVDVLWQRRDARHVHLPVQLLLRLLQRQRVRFITLQVTCKNIRGKLIRSSERANSTCSACTTHATSAPS